MGLRTALGLKQRRVPTPKSPVNCEIPTEKELEADLVSLSEKSDSVARCIAALTSGTFIHPDGRSDDLGVVRLATSEVALLSYLSRHCPTPLSIEVGFGMGSSAAIILGSRASSGQAFEHFIFDPHGLTKGRGLVVESYLKEHFGQNFQRLREHSEIGLARLLAERGRGAAGMIFIDGGHHFDQVMTDFFLADKLCCVGGSIVFDDALFPAIETVIQYIATNRKDYEVRHLIADNTTLAIKIADDKRRWFAFRPFKVPRRKNWQPKRDLRARLRKWQSKFTA